MGEFIFDISLAIIMAICIIVYIILGNWFAFSIASIVFVMDVIDAVISFKKWKKISKK